MKKNICILNIETTTKNCSVSISNNGQSLYCKEIATQGYSHAEFLHQFIQECLNKTNLRFSDLDAVAVSQGPGSYTGLRIGVSAAKGLCFVLQIPLIAIDTLTILAMQKKIEKGLIIPMIDARRMEVYSAVFDVDFKKIRAVEAQIIDENSFENHTDNLYIIGDCQEKIQSVLSKNNFIFDQSIQFPSANEMALLGFEKYKNNDFVDVAYFEPYYLKDFLILKPQAQ